MDRKPKREHSLLGEAGGLLFFVIAILICFFGAALEHAHTLSPLQVSGTSLLIMLIAFVAAAALTLRGKRD